MLASPKILKKFVDKDEHDTTTLIKHSWKIICHLNHGENISLKLSKSFSEFLGCLLNTYAIYIFRENTIQFLKNTDFLM